MLLKGCVNVVLSQGHPAREKLSQSHPGMVSLWVRSIASMQWQHCQLDTALQTAVGPAL
jgi:hypothetical protein